MRMGIHCRLIDCSITKIYFHLCIQVYDTEDQCHKEVAQIFELTNIYYIVFKFYLAPTVIHKCKARYWYSNSVRLFVFCQSRTLLYRVEMAKPVMDFLSPLNCPVIPGYSLTLLLKIARFPVNKSRKLRNDVRQTSGFQHCLVYSEQVLFKSTHHTWRYERKCEWVFFFWTQCIMRA